jgi:hypothetical protein
MEAARPSKMLVCYRNTTLRHSPENPTSFFFAMETSNLTQFESSGSVKFCEFLDQLSDF